MDEKSVKNSCICMKRWINMLEICTIPKIILVSVNFELFKKSKCVTTFEKYPATGTFNAIKPY